ncbi:Transposase [Bifidobacterium animalis subsp. animalis IM386]|uniref:Transposase n=1 Tax=Bifidobacterium animalis subsp. animalis IM386 TaxID=1402194 RepID=A0AAV2W6D1_9BIFI|nr:Transposase [Bifidobacterium animalis subsp. animalis ATCC 25527]CDI68081.1 Transposase [Bifidobacterium animalis subsp. animalis IM386]
MSGLARSTYYRLLSRPAHVTRPDLEPLVRRVWERTPNGCGHRKVRMCLVHEFGQRVSAKSVLRVMRRMGLRCVIRRPNSWSRYNSYRGESGAPVRVVAARLRRCGPVHETGHRRDRVQGRQLQGVPGPRLRHGQQGNRRLGHVRRTGPGPAEAAARPARRPPAPGRPARPALRHGMAVPAPLVARGTRTARHTPVHEPQGQLPGQRRHRAGVRPSQGRVLPRAQLRFVRTVRSRAQRLHRALEHPTTPGTTRRTHPGGIPGHVPHGPSERTILINNVQQTGRSSQWWAPLRIHIMIADERS